MSIYASIVGAKRPPVGAASSSAPKASRASDAATSAPDRHALPPDAATLLGPELSGHYHRLTDIEERIDLHLEHSRHELQSLLSTADGNTPGNPLMALVSGAPRPITRAMRVFVSTHLDRPAEDDGSGPVAWTLKVWASPHVQGAPVDADVSAVPLGDALPLSQYFTTITVSVNSEPPVKVEWRAADGASGPSGLQIARTTACPPEGLAVRVQLSMRRPLSTAVGGATAAARVRVQPNLARVLAMSPESHVAYADVEEALWIMLKERRLLDLSRREGVATIRFAGAKDLCAAFGLPEGTRSLAVSELHKYLHQQLVSEPKARQRGSAAARQLAARQLTARQLAARRGPRTLARDERARDERARDERAHARTTLPALASLAPTTLDVFSRLVLARPPPLPPSAAC